MPFSKLLKSLVGTCTSCNRRPGILSREHNVCRRTYYAAFQEMAALAAEAARDHTFDERILKLTLAEIVGRSYGDGAAINQALGKGWE